MRRRWFAKPPLCTTPPSTSLARGAALRSSRLRPYEVPDEGGSDDVLSLLENARLPLAADGVAAAVKAAASTSMSPLMSLCAVCGAPPKLVQPGGEVPAATATAALHPTRLLLGVGGRRNAVEDDGALPPPPPPVPFPDTPSASRVTTPPQQQQERTAELLHRIARSGGVGGPLRTRRGQRTHGHLSTAPGAAVLSMFAESTPHDRTFGKGAGATAGVSSPLLRLFEAPPPPLPSSSSSSSDRSFPRQRGGVQAAATAIPTASLQSDDNGCPRGLAATTSLPPSAAAPTAPPSRALLHKLLLLIQKEKRVHWDALCRAYPELTRMPLYACKEDWIERVCAQGSASPLGELQDCVSRRSSAVAPLFLCTAATGTGKSLLIPLYALDAHWRALEQRLLRSLEVYDKAFAAAADMTTAGATKPFSLVSQEAFTQEFSACSRLCIVVSQPTRVACAELAAYTSALLDAGRCHEGSVVRERNGGAETTGSDRTVLGKRVGFAVAGETRLCAETELIFATPGYILNAVQGGPSGAPRRAETVLRPTTIVVDEAHCRNVETDALLAWMKLSRESLLGESGEGLLPLRQYYVLSATMHLPVMEHYLSQSLLCSSSSSAAARLPLTLLLSPRQWWHAQQWWQREQQQQQQQRSKRALGCTSSQVTTRTLTQVDVLQAIDDDNEVRASVLQLVETAEEFFGDNMDLNGVDGTANTEAAHNVLGSDARPLPHHLLYGICPITCRPASALSTASSSSAEALREGVAASPVPPASSPFRVERYFIEDFDPQSGTFAQSTVLFSEATRAAAAAAAARVRASSPPPSSRAGVASAARAPSVTTASRTMRAREMVPLCLTQDGDALRRQLKLMYGTSAASYAMNGNSARYLALFLLQLLQAARLRWVDAGAASAAAEGSTELKAATMMTLSAPVTLILFVAGIAEVQLILQALERLCETVQSSAMAASLTASAVEVLRSGEEVFSVGVLHASAVGSLHEQLTATERAGPPLRLLLATNVAESSLTIANARVVVDTCLERRIYADDLTGATRLLTAFVSPSGLRQRGGRVGRTGDGIVIHLAPRGFLMPGSHLRPRPLPRWGSDGPTVWPSTPQKTAVAPPEQLEALPEGVLTVMLRLKFLFKRVSNALAALPSPPSAAEVQLALQQLADMDLLLLPLASPSGDGVTGSAARCGADGCESAAPPGTAAAARTLYGGSGPTDTRHDPELLVALEGSRLTGKGQLVASLPLPYEHAMLVYHGFQFGCVEDAVLVGCAMAVPSIFTAARVSAQSSIRVGVRRWTDSGYAATQKGLDTMAALSPLEQHYKRIWVQRRLAGVDVPRHTCEKVKKEVSCGSGNDDDDDGGGREGTVSKRQRPLQDSQHEATTAAGTASPSAPPKSVQQQQKSAGHLSEPLMLRALLRRWYSFSGTNAMLRFQMAYELQRTAVRQVDSMVAQCCGRLIRLLQQQQQTANAPPGVPVDEEAEADLGAYASAGAVPLYFALYSMPDTRLQLLRSLRRLQRAALSRVHLRTTQQQTRGGLPQWHESEERFVRLWSEPYRWKRRRGTAQEDDRADWRRREEMERAVRRHPSFILDRKQLPSTAPYPTLCTPACGTVADGEQIPPPLPAHPTRYRVPAYRAPAPPPPVPPVVLAMGCAEDRLCAAFVAAYGRRTLRGEDGGYRFHHRRLRRNGSALGYDAANICTFPIEVHASQQGAPHPSPRVDLPGRPDSVNAPPPAHHPSSSTSPFTSSSETLSSFEALRAVGVTSQTVADALAPYLAGTGLQQVELFQRNRLAVAARFAAAHYEGLFDSSAPSFGMPGEETKGEGVADGTTVVSGIGTPRFPPASQAVGAAITASDTTSESLPGNTGTTEASSTERERSSHGEAALTPLLLPRPLPRKRGEEDGSVGLAASRIVEHPPLVQLAPFGVSLLVAAATSNGARGGGTVLGGLQRIPLAPLSPVSATRAPSTYRVSDPVTTAASETSATEGKRGVRFSHVAVPPQQRCLGDSAEASPAAATTARVEWANSAGVCARALTWDAVAALGLGLCFPTAENRDAPPAEVGRRGDDEDDGDGVAAVPTSQPVPHALQQAAITPASPPLLTLSVVPPVYVARSITWKVPLPAAAQHAPRPRPNSWERTGHPQPVRPEHAPLLHYCIVCNRLCSSAAAFQQHCRSVGHLEHLYQAVQLGLRRSDLESLYGLAPSGVPGGGPADTHGSVTDPARMPLISLLTVRRAAKSDAAPRMPLLQCMYACTIHSQSFLNCLQWGASPNGRHRGTPLAVAGTLIAQQSTTDVLPPPHLRVSRGSDRRLGRWGGGGEEDAVSTLTGNTATGPPSVGAETLSAHHVWVLNLSEGRYSHRGLSGDGGCRVRGKLRAPALTPPPLSTLLVVAGYLAAASPQAMLALLFNKGHTHLHAIMFYGLGVWQLLSPLAMRSYMGVLEHIGRGGDWPGLLIVVGGPHGEAAPSSRGDTLHHHHHSALAPPSIQPPAKEGVAEGLHWCTPEAAGAMCVPHLSDEMTTARPPPAPLPHVAAADAVVEATLLLTLHQYRQAQRNMSSLTDYVERVLLQLQLSPFVATASGDGGNDTARPSPAALLTDFLRRARGGQSIQSLLQDLGCVFSTPPRALATLLPSAYPSGGVSDAQPRCWVGGNASTASPSSSNDGHDSSDAIDGLLCADEVPRGTSASSSLSAAWSKRLSQRALSVEGAALDMMFTVPPVLPSALPPSTFAAQLQKFYVERHHQRWRSALAPVHGKENAKGCFV